MNTTQETLDMPRREFLRVSGAAAAGLAMASSLEAAHEKSSKKIRIGVVGGNFGASFYWHEHPNCVVEAVSDLIPERRQRLMQVYKCSKSYESLEKLILDKDVDAVAVFTGAPDHVRHSVACLKAGKHVLCAVPACMSVEEAELLLDTVKQTGLTYMMAETSWYHQSVISARRWFKEGKFGKLFYTEAEYHHPGLESLFFDAQGNRTWRYGFPPMHYPTHCTGYLVGVTGERMTQVSCIGWGDDSPILKDNVYKNPFWNETAFFTTDKGNAFRVGVYWNAAVGGCERGQWIGDKMSFYDPHPNGVGSIIRRASGQTEKDDAGFIRQLPELEKHQQTQWWQTDMLPEPLRHPSGHDGSHTFLTHEFVDALVNNRRPEIDIYAALAMTVPGIIAHQSALRGGEQMKIPQFDPTR
ncbi:MAG: Gfo/Idh/MocA family oxidoreductase [Abditibacteriales bacterium]|nr:Gfo/Idh/MocA family oxidoreductase [Abditibacteriales bacterium]MDW8367578.1 Gfo/Idh/MocA family oxidoreductase [Abditibacteriales bacterium]